MDKKIKRTVLRKTKLFTNTFRFIVNLTILNDAGETERNVMEIYPSELDLKNVNDINTESSFLDLGIEIKDKRSSISSLDKQMKGFSFFLLLDCLIYVTIIVLRYFTLV